MRRSHQGRRGSFGISITLQEGGIVVSDQPHLSSPQPPAYGCHVIPERDRVRVAPYGELDLTAAPLLDETIRQLRESGFHHLVLDLRHLCFIDSTGLRLILDLDATARADSLTLDLIAGPPEIQRVFEIAGTLDRLPFSHRHRVAPRRKGAGTPIAPAPGGDGARMRG
jgi:anti-anti-sigma factor